MTQLVSCVGIAMRHKLFSHYMLDTGLLINSIKQSRSWKADSRSVNQGIPRLLWNLKAGNPVHESPPLDPVLSQINPVHTLPLHCKINLNIILPSSFTSPMEISTERRK